MLSLTRLPCRSHFVKLATSLPTLPKSPPRTPIHQHTRTITNATKPHHIPALLSIPPGPTPKPGGWIPSLIHSSGAVSFTVIRLNPGTEVPRHFHSNVWDYFIPLTGKGVIHTKTKTGEEKDYEMDPMGFLAVPPGDIHRVRNRSEEEEFVFLIAQSPRQEYDFVDVRE